MALILAFAVGAVIAFAVGPGKGVDTSAWTSSTGLNDTFQALLHVYLTTLAYGVLGTALAVILRSPAVAIALGIAYALPGEAIINSAHPDQRWIPGCRCSWLSAVAHWGNEHYELRPRSVARSAVCGADCRRDAETPLHPSRRIGFWKSATLWVHRVVTFRFFLGGQLMLAGVVGTRLFAERRTRRRCGPSPRRFRLGIARRLIAVRDPHRRLYGLVQKPGWREPNSEIGVLASWHRGRSRSTLHTPASPGAAGRRGDLPLATLAIRLARRRDRQLTA